MTDSNTQHCLSPAFSDQELISSISVTAKVLGSLFYFPFSTPENQQVLEQINQDPQQEQTGFGILAKEVLSHDKAELAADFQQLFEGCDVMPAPPWGSVYLDREQVIFGDSTLRFREFLKIWGIELQTGMREPEDQFGLMLFVLTTLCQQQLEKTDDKEKHALSQAIQVLLAEHLMPWAPSYLSQMSQHATTQSYRVLSELADHWLNYIVESLEIKPLDLRIYFTGPESKPEIGR